MSGIRLSRRPRSAGSPACRRQSFARSLPSDPLSLAISACLCRLPNQLPSRMSRIYMAGECTTIQASSSSSSACRSGGVRLPACSGAGAGCTSSQAYPVADPGNYCNNVFWANSRSSINFATMGVAGGEEWAGWHGCRGGGVGCMGAVARSAASPGTTCQPACLPAYWLRRHQTCYTHPATSILSPCCCTHSRIPRCLHPPLCADPATGVFGEGTRCSTTQRAWLFMQNNCSQPTPFGLRVRPVGGTAILQLLSALPLLEACRCTGSTVTDAAATESTLLAHH